MNKYPKELAKSKYTLSQLCWIRSNHMFRDDMIEEMVHLGIDHEIAFYLAYSDAVKVRDVIKLWHENGDLYEKEIEMYFDHCVKDCPTGWPHR